MAHAPPQAVYRKALRFPCADSRNEIGKPTSKPSLIYLPQRVSLGKRALTYKKNRTAPSSPRR
jgi:hypothetical protein